ncbi:MAG TPA: gamma-glutamyltransferase [Kiloniellaceae bacterium]|nr:gamma-glutamyltransferase [Kiloniellaceae bacterium]
MFRHVSLVLAFVVSALAVFALSSGLRAAVPPPVAAAQDMAVTAQAHGTRVAQEILAKGGNAVDAAVAAAYALAVTHPCCGNLGGGGFMTLHLAETGKEIALDFREKAPLAATKDMYLGADGEVRHDLSLKGYLAVGVPGTVMGLEQARAAYGTMSREALMAPAIALAEEGYVLTPADVAILAYGTDAFAADPASAAIFLKDGKPYAAGDRLRQPDLAKTLKAIAEDGPDAFYRGPVAEAVVKASQANGGILSLEDFAQYRAEERAPIRCFYRGFEVISMPPPSSGGLTLCLILNVLEGYPLGHMGFNSAESIHVMVEAMRRAYADRNSLLGDPDFVEIPAQRLLSKSYAAELRQSIPAFAASPIGDIKDPAELDGSNNTTQISVMDAAGNAVSLTYTINSYFGAKRIAPGTGFFLNNEMNDFTAKPGVANMFGLVQGAKNAIAPGKRPLSSMSPTLVKRNDEVFLVLGSPGGSRIITIVLQGILNVVDHGMDISQAVNAPRIHNQWLPDVVYYEPWAFTRDTLKILEQMGYSLREQKGWGALEAIMKVPKGGLPRPQHLQAFGDDSTHGSFASPGWLYGVNDSRRPAGLAAGR